ncbi:glycosyltransferase family 2 protein [Ruegeria sp. B32]|uniref:glycosyltransferase family 2 protein n=1 Tax=Ruegeria sp. B32 TaxID=2867020 RepID=UPI0021A65F7B|nr:glycosyltransferase family 2 protein [Ruegeria sp. B32]UWR06650.1 glycosyltransferase family 2 protein [Ruegeria sp. B32]
MIVIPMAGLSSRFYRSGYTKPKYMLNVYGRSVFRNAVQSFQHYFGKEHFLFIYREIDDTRAFLVRELQEMGLSTDMYQLAELSHETSGQAETVALGLRATDISADEPLTIFNIDTFRPGFRYPTEFDLSDTDGYVEVFKGEGEHWSFVRPDSTPNIALEVAEKVRISDLCSSGLYYFKSAKFFFSLYQQIETTDPKELQGGERYIAPLYNRAIQQGAKIYYHTIPIKEVIFCGTPDEYEALKRAES